tara:strand:- start:387 stop:869 length:483 start_codon:yes stop_codon:yes gene_type:complete
MKKLIFLLLLLITQINFGQSNIVDISTTGSGETKEEAVQNALLSALKQSFGVFISSNTEIINDVLTKDKISELSSGNILEYNIISETENGNYYNTLVSQQNQNNYSINVKEIYPKLVLVPFVSYITTNRLYTGGFSHEFNLFLTLDNLDKIKDVKIINLN